MAHCDKLIDTQEIELANERHQEVRHRLAEAREALAAAHAEIVEAKAAYQWELGEGGDVKGARKRLDNAEANLKHATEWVPATELAVQRSADDVARAKDVAHRRLYVAGVKQRLAAAKAADAARKALAAAEREYAEATGTITAAIQGGASDVVFGRHLQHHLTDHATELLRWTANYHNAWWSPQLIQEGI